MSWDPRNADWQQGLAASHQNIGRILADQGDLATELASYRSCTRIREKLAADDPSNGLTRRYLAIADEEVGDILLLPGDRVGALEKLRLAVARFRALATENPENLLLRGDLGSALKELGDAERLDNDFESGLSNLNEAPSIFGRQSLRRKRRVDFNSRAFCRARNDKTERSNRLFPSPFEPD